MNMSARTLHLILLMIGISLGVIVSAQGEAPAPFFKKDVAKCFYCADDAKVQSGPKKNDSGQINSRKDQTRNLEQPLAGVDPKSPLPFQELVRAYEQGDMGETYRAAKEWVQYQDRILKRTSDLAALVVKAKKEVESETQMTTLEDSPSPSSDSVSNVRLAFFFDISNPKTEEAANHVQDFYRVTLADPSVEVYGIPAFSNSIEELKTFKRELGLNFPMQYNQKMENEFEASSAPMILAFRDNNATPCRLEGSITTESISDLINRCSVKQSVGRPK